MARNPLSLHHLNALDVGAVELIGFAGRLGTPHVCLFTHSPIPGFPIVTGENEAEVLEALKVSGVSVYNVEFVAVTPDMSFEGLPEALARSRRLGAQRMTVHVHDADEARAVETFAQVCGLAAAEGLAIGLEWTAANLAIGSLEQAVRFLRLADRPNAALAVDLLHLIRSGGAPSQVRALAPDLVGYAQISDGPLERSIEDYLAVELISERLPPGEGELPTAEFVAAIPENRVIEVEAPQSAARAAGATAFECCRRSVEAARRFVPA
jgi:sugar phosphate isomerase/epimerase